ncbi:hypothetical protein GLIP_1297 [Aliiglaciecola lipolytica E3]|uniref:Uncharacterized protein n=1 Tax=Aliiglaciecola lipolytica E3 TaxID=1127673 RepID=K6YBC4_9ALTE|nr:hypothetical protein GLIP_1297 [Aliiglaciecola lipolytica E3]
MIQQVHQQIRAHRQKLLEYPSKKTSSQSFKPALTMGRK